MQNKRTDFINNIWDRYPSPEAKAFGHSFCGRLINISDNSIELLNSNSKLVVTAGSKKSEVIQTFLKAKLVWAKAKEAKATNTAKVNSSLPGDILNVGDWIQIYSNSIESDCFSVILLAPCLNLSFKEIKNKELYRNWMQFKRKIKDFFILQQFDEIETPTLVECPGTEPFLEPFITWFEMGRTRKKLYLPTSPELSLKKCLAEGWKNIFEIKSCFRNGEMSAYHKIEFNMLEWYRSFVNLEIIKEDIFKLLDFIQFPNWKLESLSQMSMQELFQIYCKFELTPQTTVEELRALVNSFAHSKDLNIENWDFDDVFNFIYVEKIESQLHHYPFLILEKYPPSQAALARITADGWGDRFEFYINGVEIANAFHELNDPVIQKMRFQEDLEKKKIHHKTEIDLDHDFIDHLESGIPPSSGIALGVERLFMSFYGINNINKISPYVVENKL